MKCSFFCIIAVMCIAAVPAEVKAQNLLMTPGINTQLYNMQNMQDEDEGDAYKCVIDCDEKRFGVLPKYKTVVGKNNKTANKSPLDFTFKPTTSLRETTYNKIFTAEMRKQLTNELGGRDLIDLMGTALQQYGLRTDNVADAMAVWAIGAHDIFQGANSKTSKATAQAVKAQFAYGLNLAYPSESSDLSDATKQRFAEQLLIYSFFYDQALMKKETEPAAFQEIQKAAQKHSKQMGIDFSSLKLVPGEGLYKSAIDDN